MEKKSLYNCPKTPMIFCILQNVIKIIIITLNKNIFRLFNAPHLAYKCHVDLQATEEKKRVHLKKVFIRDVVDMT